jgi:hypothetical protein
MTTSAPSRARLASDEIESRLARYSRQRPEILAVYLFGSVARGQAGPLSDLDIALLLEPAHRRLADSFAYQASRLSDLMALLETDAVDLVLLPAPSPLLQHRILRDKRVLFCRNDRRRLTFEIRASQTYLDLQPLYAAQTRRFFERVRAGHVGQASRYG